MNPDLSALLTLQAEDAAISALEARRREFDERVAALDRERAGAVEALDHARVAVQAAERKRNDLAGKIEQHKQAQERNLAHLDAVRKPREAAAAMAEVEMRRRVLAQDESELQVTTARLHDLRQAAELQAMELADLDQRQQAARDEIADARRAVEEELRVTHEKRVGAAGRVSRPMLSKYERIRGRQRDGALFQIRGAACGHCNTAIPVQRRNLIAAGRAIEVCEGCGVLLYAAV